jgi:16S rRNA (cytidine1402-2'-O)-methyltransferase
VNRFVMAIVRVPVLQPQPESQRFPQIAVRHPLPRTPWSIALAENRQGPTNRATTDNGQLAERVSQQLDLLRAAPLAPGLYIVSTPIGHLGDITLRALAAIEGADILYCEDTRNSRHLLTHFGISQRPRSYHEHNADQERPRILGELAAGRSVVLISDAGTPLVSDPGFKLARAALEAGHRVVSVPGASAPIAALTCSGLPPDLFLFAGFLPPKRGARLSRLAELAAVRATLVFFEGPSRVSEALADMAQTFGSKRQAVVARELTKMHEEVMRGTLAELGAWAGASTLKGEIVILVGPPLVAEVNDDRIETELKSLLGTMSVRDASKAAADALGVSRTRVYDLAVRLKRGGE